MNRQNYKRGLGSLQILGVVVVIIILGLVVYYATNHSSPSGVTNTDSSTSTNVSVKGTSSSGSIRDLLALGKNLMCTIDESSATSTVTGTMYISGNMMSGEFTSSSKGSLGMISHMIRNGDTVYAWSASQGAKMTFTNLTGTSAQSKSSVNLDQKVGYKCSDWSVDNSKFAVPTNVKFTDVSAMMNNQINTKGNAGAPVYAQ